MSLVKDRPGAVRAVPLWCNCWTCDMCADRRARQVQGALSHGNPTKFLTLTVDANRGVSAEQRARTLKRAFTDWVRRLRLRFPGQEVEYGYVFEKTQAGEPHLHVLGRWPFVPQAEISAYFEAQIGAPVVWIEAVKSRTSSAAYLSKYLSKDCTRFGTQKRYGFSKGYRAPRRVRQPEDSLWRGPWVKVNRRWEDLALSYIVRGWRLIDHNRLWFLEATEP